MGCLMTRSTAVVFIAYLPLLGCAKPALEAPDPEGIPPANVVPDRRPEVRRTTAGEDITQLVRNQNAPGSEPPAPKRKGVAAPTSLRPSVRRTRDGFVARLPGARSVPTPAYYRGRIYTGGYGAYEMHAISATTGARAWSLHLSDDGPTDPACQDGICVFNTYSCTMFGVDAETGRHLWSWYLGSPQLATPIIAGDTVYTSYPERGSGAVAPYALAAFDLKTGAPRWRRWIDAEVNSTPVAYGGHVYVATRLGTLYEFAAKDGAVVAAWQNRIASPPVLMAEGVIFGRDEAEQRDNDMLVTSRVLFPYLETVDAPRRAVKPQPRPLVARNRMIRIEKGVVVATERRTGRRLWQHRLSSEHPADVPAPLLYAGDSILLATSGGNVLRLTPETGEVISTFLLGQGPLASQPIAAKGWIYAGTNAGSVVAFDTGAPELTGWEMLGGGPDRRGSADTEGT